VKNKKLLAITVIFIIVVLLAGYRANAPRSIGSEVWSGTVNVTGDLYVQPWATLTIEPGTVVRVSPSDDEPGFSTEILPDGFNDNDPTRLKEYDETHITISGKIIALGTKESPIIFTSASPDPRIADWSGLGLMDGSRLDHVVVEYVRTPGVEGDDVEITNSVFRHSMWGGISLGDKSPRIINNTIYDCGHEGLDVHGGAPYIANNLIYECNTGIVVISDNLEVAPGRFFHGRSDPMVVNNIILNNGNGIGIMNSDGTYISNTITSPVGPSHDWCYEDFCYENTNYGNAVSADENSNPTFVNNLLANRAGGPAKDAAPAEGPPPGIPSYENFASNNAQHARPITKEQLDAQIIQASDYLLQHPEGMTAENVTEKIIEKLNIGFLLDGIGRGSVSETVVRHYADYTEKELMFTDPQVGNFSALLLVPKGTGLPAIVGLHGHGDSKEIFKRDYFGEKLAKEGFVVIMPSFRAMECGEEEKNISEELLLNGFTLMGMRIYETQLLVEYLKGQDFVDSSRIGIIGHSGGGETTNIAARVIPDLKAGVYDFSSNLLDLCKDSDACTASPSAECRVHCETIPGLAYYGPQIRNNSSASIPLRMFDYKYPGINDWNEILAFFNENLK